MTTDVLEKISKTEAVGTPVLRWVKSSQEANDAAKSEDRRIVWIVRNSKLAARIIRLVEWPGKRAGFVVIAGQPSPGVIPALLRRFERVAFSGDAHALSTDDELVEVLTLSDRSDRFLCGIVDDESGTLTLWRGDLTPLVVPLSTFTPTANGIRPDFSKFSVTDYGHTIRFGSYEAASDGLLYDFDPDFRQRLNRQRRATERTLGASIRRLRMQRQLTRNDFPGIDPKTLARIELNEVTKPHVGTLGLIAETLRVSVDDLGRY